jgi:hypothetical protein
MAERAPALEAIGDDPEGAVRDAHHADVPGIDAIGLEHMIDQGLDMG